MQLSHIACRWLSRATLEVGETLVCCVVFIVAKMLEQDQSLVQDEDILASFGAEVLVPPFLTNCGISAGYAIKNSHCLVVTGKADFKEVSKAEASNIKASLKARGFEIP